MVEVRQDIPAGCTTQHMTLAADGVRLLDARERAADQRAVAEAARG